MTEVVRRGKLLCLHKWQRTETEVDAVYVHGEYKVVVQEKKVCRKCGREKQRDKLKK